MTAGSGYDEGGVAVETGDAWPAPGGPEAPGPPGERAGYFDKRETGDVRLWFAAPLRAGSRLEVTIRVVLAVLLLLDLALTGWSAMHGPRYVADSTALLRDAAAGRVLEVDLQPEDEDLDDRVGGWPVVWRTEDAVYYSARPPDVRFSDRDLRAAVAAQPYVAAHPDSVAYGSVHEPRSRGLRLPGSDWFGFAGFLVAVALIIGPQPRRLTKWAWFFSFYTGIGLVLYLLMAGSWRALEHRQPPRRVNGWMAYGGLALAGVVAATLLREPMQRLTTLRTPPHANHGPYVPYVPSQPN